MVPLFNVPVTTVPKPLILKQRSIGNLTAPLPSRGSTCCSCRRITSNRTSSPIPATAETRQHGAFSRKVPTTCSRTSSSIISSQSGSTRSHLEITRIPFCSLSSSMICRCSRVCCITPSLASTTSSTRSIPAMPLSIWGINFSCPGTSTTPAIWPLPRSRRAKPSSIDIPRFFSSARRSVSTPVKQRIRAVLP